jgi:hypothetical protein
LQWWRRHIWPLLLLLSLGVNLFLLFTGSRYVSRFTTEIGNLQKRGIYRSGNSKIQRKQQQLVVSNEIPMLVTLEQQTSMASSPAVRQGLKAACLKRYNLGKAAACEVGEITWRATQDSDSNTTTHASSAASAQQFSEFENASTARKLSKEENRRRKLEKYMSASSASEDGEELQAESWNVIPESFGTFFEDGERYSKTAASSNDNATPKKYFPNEKLNRLRSNRSSHDVVTSNTTRNRRMLDSTAREMIMVVEYQLTASASDANALDETVGQIEAEALTQSASALANFKSTVQQEIADAIASVSEISDASARGDSGYSDQNRDPVLSLPEEQKLTRANLDTLVQEVLPVESDAVYKVGQASAVRGLRG